MRDVMLPVMQCVAQVMVRDLYAARDLGPATGSYTALVNGQDCAVLRLTPLKPSPHHEAWRPWHSPLQEQLQMERGQAAASATRPTEAIQARVTGRKRSGAATLGQVLLSRASSHKGRAQEQ